MAKYDPLTELLRRSAGPVEMTFDVLDRLVGGLPRSAREHRSWWGNTVNTSHVHAAAWVSVGWLVELDMTNRRVTFVRGVPETRPQGTRSARGPDGAAQLAEILAHAGYPSTMHAVAAHTITLDPSVVAQTSGLPVFATVRRDVRFDPPIGTVGERDGMRVMYDDNRSPTVAFLWAAGHGAGRDVQYNHIWPSSPPPLPTPPCGTCAARPRSSPRRPTAGTIPRSSPHSAAGRSSSTATDPPELPSRSHRSVTTRCNGHRTHRR